MAGTDRTVDGDVNHRTRDTCNSTPRTGSIHATATIAAMASEKTSAGSARNVPHPRGPKRRTKTGCLTCRKRRIKCGEEKPRCNNCIKAKRECEGYTQRVIFKHPMGPLGAFHPELGRDMQPMAMRMPLFPQQQGQPSTGQGLNPQQRLLAPRMPLVPVGSMAYASAHPESSTAQENLVDQPRPFYYPPVYETPLQSGLPQPSHATPPVHSTGSNHAPGSQQSPNALQNAHSQSFNPDSSYPGDHGHDHPTHLSGTRSQTSDQRSSLEHEYLESMNIATQGQRSSWGLGEEAPPSQITLPVSSHRVHYDDESDDYYDVDTDEDMEEATQEESFNQLSLIMASARQDETPVRSYTTFLNEPNILASYRPSMGSSPLNNPKTARIWVHFIHATSAALSIWERRNTNTSILVNGPVPASQRGLWSYTMPLKSLEHPALLQAILAISSLHIAKLQGASLTITLKHYHYALRKIHKAVGLPVRRKQVSTLATTLLLAFYEVIAAEHGKWNSHVAGAAQLIKEIDFAGLTRDLRAQRRNLKAQRQEWWGQYDDLSSFDYAEDDPFADKESEIDESILGAITGKAVDYDRMGHIEHDAASVGTRKKHFTRKDIETFTIQRDLYWWYCKQDLFQSMISGNRLYTPYDRWDQCPPRAGLGKLDALYGSFDHLVLLMGRMMDFGYRDRKRKIKSLEATGGEWRPHQDFFKFMGRFGSKSPGGGPPGSGAGPPSSTPGARSSHESRQGGDYVGPTSSSSYTPDAGLGPTNVHIPPARTSLEQAPMYGMVPSAGSGEAPAAFTSTGDSPPYAGSTDEDGLMSTSEAEAEWESIRAAYDLYARQLGAGFSPLPADIATPIATPFGPALQYRSHLIAVLWAFYYAGRIMLHRLHPCMSPAAMVAAGAAAGTTAQYAQIVGKIAAGIYYPQRSNLEAGSLNPTLGAALTEVTVPMFFAGVQFTDAAQRGWTVAKLRNIARITGWQSAAAIAGGCEAAWYFAGKAGRAPPYASYEVKTVLDEAGLRRIRRDQEADKQVHLDPNNDRRFVQVVKSARTHWAMGILEMEDDLINLNLDDDPRPQA